LNNKITAAAATNIKLKKDREEKTDRKKIQSSNVPSESAEIYWVS
jgi:hypothetical protein